MKLVEKVKRLCDEEGTTIAALERVLGFGCGAIRKWDKAIPSGDRLAKVADHFHVTVDYLLGREQGARDELNSVYFNFAKDAERNAIDPEDIKAAIELIKKYKNK
jgi:transcriptional regulator with XRE-family HTH domain